MDAQDPVIALCFQGAQAEFAGRIGEARAFYWQAWEQSTDDFEACIAAHYVARFQENPQERLRWDLEALARADRVGDGRVQDFYPSLYVNLGRSYGLTGAPNLAAHYYQKAADLGLVHEEGDEFHKPA
jgi:hypothetical protein